MILVDHLEDWRYRKGTNEPQVGWQTLPDGSLDATWLAGPGGFGYGDGDDATVLPDMQNNYTTVYIRQTFTIGSPIETNLLVKMVVDWDAASMTLAFEVEVVDGESYTIQYSETLVPAVWQRLRDINATSTGSYLVEDIVAGIP